jgi:thiol:disulfide interchange protein DsbC
MQRIEHRWSQRVRRAAFAIGLSACALAAQALAQSPASGPAATPVATPAATPVATPPVPSSPAASTAPAAEQSPEAAAIRKTLEQRFPGANISHIAKSTYFGLYEVMLDDNLIYTDPGAAYVFVGSVYDTATKQNLTEARSRKLNRVAIAKLPYELAFKRVKGDGSRKLVIFSDADCPFCHRLENEIRNLDNVTIYTFLFPIDQLHPNAAQKSKQIWCSADKAKAWDAFFASGKLPDNKGDCGDPVAKTQALGASLHINATPTLIFADGTMIPGALPLPQIEKEMASAEAEAKKVAASAPK